MNKQLLIVRHAKSDWGNIDLRDFDRPLNERGFKSANNMGERLLAKAIKPDFIISSPALRAITTCEIITNKLGLDEKTIITNKNIYEARTEQLLNIVNELDNDNNLVVLFGHNNGVTDLTVYLTDADIFNIPTCGMVLIDFPFNDWKMVSKNTGTVNFYDYPKNKG